MERLVAEGDAEDLLFPDLAAKLGIDATLGSTYRPGPLSCLPRGPPSYRRLPSSFAVPTQTITDLW